MNIVLSTAVVLACVTVAVVAMLAAQRRAPDGGHFKDSDRAAGVFGVLATGFALLLGLVVVLAFTSYDDSRAGAETEALLVAQQYETAQFMPEDARPGLGDGLVCYARSVVALEWPRMEDGTLGNDVNPWAAKLFRQTRAVEPGPSSEQAAFGKWLDQTSDREAARNDRIHGAAGVIPGPLWLVLLFTAVLIFAFMLFFADSGEGPVVQSMMIGSVTAVMVATLLLISFLDSPFSPGFGGLRPTAMERTLDVLEQERAVADETGPIPCDQQGRPT